MFQKFKKNYITAISMALVLLFVNTLGLLLNSNINDITKPVAGNWANYTTPVARGSGTEDDPYIIMKAEELSWVAQNGRLSFVELGADINLGGHEWTPIPENEGTSSETNKIGGFDGKNHAIKNLTINLPNQEVVGFFKYTNIEVKNLVFINATVVGGAYVGVVAGQSHIKADNIIIQSGTVTAVNTHAGGIVCYGGGGTIIRNCVNNATVIAPLSAAGIISQKENSGIIENCINTGSIIGGADVGGIVGCFGGYADADIIVRNCYSEGTISGNVAVGGVGGGLNDSTPTLVFENCGFNGKMVVSSDTANYFGSIVGRNLSSIPISFKNCFGVVTFHLKNTDAEIVNNFGVPSNVKIESSYSYSKIITKAGLTEKRKYKAGSAETPFSDMAVHKNINGGYPFPKTMFTVGQFIESDVLGYLKNYGFGQASYEIYQGKSHYYVELGQYPQTYVGDALNSTLKSWYSSSKPTSVDSYTNDLSTNADTITHYAYNYNGIKYVRVISAVMQGSYKTQDESATLSSGNEYWFKVEPIKWRVLNYTEVQNGAAPIVIAEQGLTANVAWNTNTTDQTLWASKSNIRTWLNTTFYNDALSEVKDEIQTTKLKNNSLSDYTDGTGTTTTDNVWLLSYGEVYGESSTKYSEKQYFNSDKERLCSPTDYALVNNCYIYVSTSNSTEQRPNGGSCHWWLRSVHTSLSNYVRYVSYLGSLSASSADPKLAVRPALTLVV